MARDEKLWMRRNDVARLIGLSARQFDSAVKPELAAQHVRGRGATLRYFAPGVVETRIAQLLEAERPAAEDPLLYAGNSPNLEELRKWKAKEAEVSYRERVGALIPRSELRPTMTALMKILQRANETIQRQFGNGPSEVLDEALSEIQAQYRRLERTETPAAE